MDPGHGTDDAAVTARPRGAARQRTRGAAVTGAALLAALAVAGCGSASVSELPPPAGPDRAPATTQMPAGRVSEPGRAAGAVRALAADRLPARARRLVPAGVLPGGASALRGGSLVAIVRPRARTVEVYDTASGERRSSAPAGVGPAAIQCAPLGPCFVLDTQGDALLVVRVGEGGRSVRVTRRVYVAGAPYAIAMNEERLRLWVTLTARNEVVELGAHGRPHILQRLPTVRQPDSVAVDQRTGDVLIAGEDGRAIQTIPSPASPSR